MQVYNGTSLWALYYIGSSRQMAHTLAICLTFPFLYKLHHRFTRYSYDTCAGECSTSQWGCAIPATFHLFGIVNMTHNHHYQKAGFWNTSLSSFPSKLILPWKKTPQHILQKRNTHTSETTAFSTVRIPGSKWRTFRGPGYTLIGLLPNHWVTCYICV